MKFIRKMFGRCAVKISCVLILFGLLASTSRAQLPPFPSLPVSESWSFYDPTNWFSDDGYAPIGFTNIVCDESAWSSDDGILDCNGLILDSTNAALLNYKVVETNGHANLSLAQGTVWFWFSPDWTSATADDSGTGPGVWGRFIDAGAYTTNAAFGWWSLLVSPDGNNIYFSGQTNGMGTNYLSAPISWTAGSWHLIGLTYMATNSILYIDGEVATNGIGVSYWPGHDALTNGFWIGSDFTGTQQAHGEFVDVETWDIRFSDYFFSSYYDEMLPELPGSFFRDSFSPPDFSSGGGTNFPDIYGTNVLWLYIAGIQSNTAGLFLVNTEPDVSYEIQSKTDLLLTNWNSEGFVLGSELTNWTEMDIAQGNRTTNLFFRIRSAQSSDETGLPDWWQQLYFGSTDVDPNADPEGDGWSNIQKFQNGMNPTNFYTPPAPQGLTVSFNSSSGVASVSWLPSPGNVTGYTVKRGDYDLGGITTFTVSSNAFSISDTITDSPDFNMDYVFGITGPEIDIAYQVQANYGSSGDSALSDPVALEPSYYYQSGVYYGTQTLPVSLVAGFQGTAYLAVSALPANTAFVRLSRVDDFAHSDYSVDSLDTNLDIPVSAFTNGLFLLPSSLTSPAADTYGANDYIWYVELIDASNNPTVSQELTFGNSYTATGSSGEEWMVSPYYDGRAQLKQNLTFLLRSPNAVAPFDFAGLSPVVDNTYSDTIVYTSSNYVYADFSDASGVYSPYANDGVFAPFANNYLYENFVYSTTNVNSGGAMTTGVASDYYEGFYDYFGGYGMLIQEPWSYEFQPPSNGSTISSRLPASQTTWLFAPPLSYLYAHGITNDIGISASTNSTPIWTLSSSAKNYWGLPYVSVKLAYGSGSTYTLSPGGSFQVADANVYIQTAQPGFQLVEYDFNMAAAVGSTNFSTTNTSNPAIITSVGNPFFGVNGYAKLAVTNSVYSGVYGYLGQYFDKAYAISNGVVTTNTTGVLSSYGNFFATQPGPVALVTMPDIDTGTRGTGIVYAVSLQLDANHDGNMDLTFNGADATRQSAIQGRCEWASPQNIGADAKTRT